MDRFWAKVDGRGTFGCWEWTGALRAGYGAFKLDGKVHGAHRIAWEIVRGEIPAGLWVLHHCDNRRCVNPTHLFLGTRSDNMLDAWAKGRISPPLSIQHGIQNGNAKLTEADVRAIRTRYAAGEAQVSIVQDFPVSKQQVCDIVHRKYWTHI